MALYITDECINCDVCRKFAPEIFGNSGQNSYIKKDIKSEDEWLQFQRALLSCPVKAIGDQSRRSIATARDTLPFKLSDGIYINGFNDRSSFGADSYFLTGTDGNWMVDSPSFNRHLVKKIENLKKPVIFCCASGMRSGQANSIAKSRGINAFNGGGWSALNRKLNK